MADSRRRTILNAIPLVGALCAIAGAVDVIAYILFGKIFIANMTGNTVFFAASVILRDWREAALRLGVVIAFLSGILIAQAVLRKVTSGRDRQRALITLAIEFAVLSWLALMPHPDTLRVALLMVLAFSLGMQNNAFRTIGPVKLSTAFISGDLENLGEAIVDSEDPDKREIPSEHEEAMLKTAIFLTTWVAYGIGALLGAYSAFHFAEKALWMPAGLVVVAAVMVLQLPAQTR